MRRIALLTATFLLFVTAEASAQQLVPFGGQTYSSPYYVTGEPGNPSRVYVVEAEGRIRVVDGGKAKAVVDLSASDAAGNRSTATHRIKQRP